MNNKSCRNCENFIRILIEDSYLYPRGFCFKGQKEYDYSLYCSSSISRRCIEYKFSNYNNDTWELELKYMNSVSNLTTKILDKRTKEYKTFVKYSFNKELINYFKYGKLTERYLELFLNENVSKELSNIINEYFKEDIENIKSRSILPYSDYENMMLELQSRLNDLRNIENLIEWVTI